VGVLAAAAFVYLAAEMFPVGVVPQLADGLHTTVPAAGLLVGVYALVAGAAIIPVALATKRIESRVMLIAALASLSVSQLLLAAAPSIGWAVLARVVGAILHGSVWSLAPVLASQLAPPGRAGQATALVFVGASLGLAAAAPLTTQLSLLIGWRATSLALAVLALVLAVAIAVLIPRDIGRDAPAPAAGQPGEPRTVAVVCVLTVLVVTAAYVPYSFITVLASGAGIPAAGLPVLLLGYGVAALTAVVVAGRWLDRHRVAVVGAALTGLLIAFATLTLTGSRVLFVGAVLLWGAAFACWAPAMQTILIKRCPDAAFASYVYVLAFQVGIFSGAWAGAQLVAADAAALLTVFALIGIGCATPVAVLARRRL
jgi:predicted MFS family arabinose efflux permease